MDDAYKQFFVQRLEKLNLEFMGRLLDSETQRALLETKLVETQKLYEESQKQVEIQNDMMKQAATSIETQTIESSRYERTIKDLQEKLEEKEKSHSSLFYEGKDKDTKIEELQKQLTQIDMFRNELNMTRTELNTTYAELQETKSELEKYTKSKKKVKEDDNF